MRHKFTLTILMIALLTIISIGCSEERTTLTVEITYAGGGKDTITTWRYTHRASNPLVNSNGCIYVYPENICGVRTAKIIAKGPYIYQTN